MNWSYIGKSNKKYTLSNHTTQWFGQLQGQCLHGIPQQTIELLKLSSEHLYKLGVSPETIYKVHSHYILNLLAISIGTKYLMEMGIFPSQSFRSCFMYEHPTSCLHPHVPTYFPIKQMLPQMAMISSTHYTKRRFVNQLELRKLVDVSS